MTDRLRVVVILGLLAVPSLRASDEGRGRFGLQLSYSKPMGTETVPMVGPGPNFLPQGSQDAALAGIGTSFEWRLGANGNLRRFSIVPNLSYGLGSTRDSQGFPALMTNLGGLPVALANATAQRKTSTTEAGLMVPVRAYLGREGWQSEGFFLEFGPGVVRTEQKVDLTLAGSVAGQAVSLPDSVRYSKNRMGWTGGFGSAWPVGTSSWMSAGLSYVRLAEAGTLPTKAARVYVQWTF